MKKLWWNLRKFVKGGIQSGLERGWVAIQASDEGITGWHSVTVLMDWNVPSETSDIAAELTIRIPVLANNGWALLDIDTQACNIHVATLHWSVHNLKGFIYCTTKEDWQEITASNSIPRTNWGGTKLSWCKEISGQPPIDYVNKKEKD